MLSMEGTIKRKIKDPTRGSHTVNTAASLPSGVFVEGELMRSHTGEPAASISNGTPSSIAD